MAGSAEAVASSIGKQASMTASDVARLSQEVRISASFLTDVSFMSPRKLVIFTI